MFQEISGKRGRPD